jgi:outer membrane protein assembly factor BamE (lipoprotein component of BamABCDE complex)
MKLLITLSLLLGLAGCASTSGVEAIKNIEAMRPDMSKAEILSLLGSPDLVVPGSQTDRWVYEFKRKDNQGRNFFVDFVDAKMVASGELDGREIAESHENSVSGSCTRRVQKEVMPEVLCIK